MKCRVLKKRGEAKLYTHVDYPYCLKFDKKGMSYIFPEKGSNWTLHLAPHKAKTYPLSTWQETDYDSVKKRWENA
jgi:hypothetical protein